MAGLIKTICLIRGKSGESYPEFRERILAMLKIASAKEEILDLRVVLTDKKPPAVSVIPFRKEKIASVSIKSGRLQDFGNFTGAEGFSGAFEVKEAIPVGYEKTWKDMEPTPGVNLLTLFRKKASIDQDTFIRRWHNGHTPLSLKIHPLWNYNRNEVLNEIIPGSESWDGIVEEHFRTQSDLLNPARFFGSPWTMLYRMVQVFMDTRSFLDYSTIQTFLATEYHIKTRELSGTDYSTGTGGKLM